MKIIQTLLNMRTAIICTLILVASLTFAFHPGTEPRVPVKAGDTVRLVGTSIRASVTDIKTFGWHANVAYQDSYGTYHKVLVRATRFHISME